MPFIKRKSNPIRISQNGLNHTTSISDDLECVANHTMCGIMLQLSNLNNHATDLFDDLVHETKSIHNRTNNLRTKVLEMTEKYKHWNKMKAGASFEKGDMEDETPLSCHFDQQLLTQSGRPASIMALYQAANQPPAITKTNQFRDDGKDGLTLYTDPTFFFKDWYKQMEQKNKGWNYKPDIKTKRRKTRMKKSNQAPRKVNKKIDEQRRKVQNADYIDTNKNQKSMSSGKTRTQRKLDNVKEEQHEEPTRRTEEQKASNEVENRDFQQSATADDDTPPPVPMRRTSSRTSSSNDIPPPNPTLDGLPDLPPPPPLPPDLINNDPVERRSSFILPPAPSDFFRSSLSTELDMDFPLPPSNESDAGFPLPPPPEDDELPPFLPSRSQRSNSLRSKRISTFVFPDSVNVVPPQPSIQQPPIPAPPPPPPPFTPTQLPLPAQKGTESSIQVKRTDASSDRGNIPTENALLAMKKKLQTKERILKAPPIEKTNQLDVHSIMKNAIESKFTMPESSEEDSESFDSDSDWD